VRLVLRRLALASIFTVAPLAPAFAYCIEETAGLAMGTQTVPVRHFLCGAESQRQPAVKVSFHHLTSGTASVLLDGRSSTVLTKLLGKPKLVRNETSDMFTMLLRDYGRDKTFAAESQMSALVGTRQEPTGAGDNEQIDGRRVTELERSIDFPAITLNAELRKGTAWPVRFGLEYVKATPGETPSATTFVPARGPRLPQFNVNLWTFLTQKEMDGYERERERYNAPEILGKKFSDRGEFLRALREKALNSLGGEFEFERKLAGGRMPDDFALITGAPTENSCTSAESPVCCWVFAYEPRTVVLETMLVENITQIPMRLERVLGDLVTQGLRPLGAQTDAGRYDASAIQPVGLELKPGERALIPMRMLLLPPTSIQHMQRPRDQNASELFSRISARSDGTLFQFGQGARRVGKLKESFRPPSPPKMKTYVYGPEVLPRGLSIDGQPVTFSRREAQVGGTAYNQSMRNDPIYIDITIEEGQGSCPYLSVWDAERARWVDQGKVLDKAKGRALEETETRIFPGFQGRFLLSEREPEAAFIDRAALTVTLKDGRKVDLKAAQSRIDDLDGKYSVLMWGDRMEVTFALPKDIAESDVISSALSLTGYYERYESVAANTSGQPKKK
jgi:hypothetical protein